MSVWADSTFGSEVLFFSVIGASYQVELSVGMLPSKV